MSAYFSSDEKRENPRKISVCHLLPALPAHGAEQLLLDIVRHTDRNRVNLSVCLISGLGPLVTEFEALGIPVTFLPKRSRKDVSIAFRLAASWKKNRFDLIHTHLFTADLWGRFAGLFSQVPIVSTSHTTSDPNIGPLGRWLDRMLDRRNNAVICVSEAVRRYRIEEAGFDPKKLHLIENGIDLDRFQKTASKEEMESRLGLPSGRRWAVIVGRLVSLKGHRFLIDALSLLVKDIPDLGLLIVGDGEEEKELKKLVDEKGLMERIFFLGLRRDIADILGMSEVLVLPSSREGLPIVLLEAMAAGLPVVVTPVGGIPEVVMEGKTGFFVSQEPMSIASALRRIFENPAMARAMGSDARKLIEERYDIRVVARRYENLYRRLLEKTLSGSSSRFSEKA